MPVSPVKASFNDVALGGNYKLRYDGFSLKIGFNFFYVLF